MHESDVKAHMRVRSRHFPDGDVSKLPNPTLGKILTSPMKKRESRAKRARKRKENRQLYDSESPAPFAILTKSTVSPQPFTISPSFSLTWTQTLLVFRYAV